MGKARRPMLARLFAPPSTVEIAMSLLQALRLPPPPPQRPAQGQIGHVAPYDQQGRAGYDAGGRRITEHEHVIPRGKQEALTRNPATGASDYTDAHYGRNTTVRVERDTALQKTHANRNGPTADNAGTRRLQAKSVADDPRNGIDYREEVFLESVDNMKRATRATGSAVTDAQVHEAALGQDGELFGMQRMKDTRGRLGASAAEVDAAADRLDFGAEEGGMLRHTVETARAQAKTELARQQKWDDELERKVKATKGDVQKGWIESRARLRKKIDETVASIEQADTDLEALGNAHTEHAELARIRARHGSGTKLAAHTDEQAHGTLQPGAGRRRDESRTTSSFDGQTAKVDTSRSTTTVGAKGVTHADSDESTTSNALMESKRARSKKTQVSWTGKASTEETTSHEVKLKDGRSSTVESTRASEIGRGGASRSETHKVKNLDGSSTATTRKQSVERGDGKVTATTSAGRTVRSATGTEHAREGSASGGFSSGKDGIGAHGALEGGRSATTKGGRQAGVVGGLHANVSCKVSPGKGEPPKYEVTLVVSFGGSLGASAGSGKQEGSKKSVDVKASVSLEKSMTVVHVLDATQLEGYVKSLEAASKGSQVAAAYNEFAVIAAGVKANDWGVARDVWKGLSADTATSLRNEGDSVEFAQKKNVTVGGGAKAYGVGIAKSVSETDTSSQKIARNAKGTLDAEGKGAHAKESRLSGSLDVGVAGATAGTTTIHETRFGFAIEIDPKDDPAGQMLAALGKCRKKADFQAFLKAWPKAKLVSRSDGVSDASTSEAGLTVLGKGIKLGEGHGIDEDTRRDAKGKLIEKRVASHSGYGGALLGLSDSERDETVTQVDRDGEATWTGQKVQRANYGSEVRAKKGRKLVERMQGKGAAAGPLAAMAGGDDEEESVQIQGITLSNDDLAKLGGMACRSPEAWRDGPMLSPDDIKDWVAAGAAIRSAGGKAAAVGEQLSRFTGKDSDRLRKVLQFLRAGYHSKVGMAFEFPDSLRDLQDDYNLVVDPKLAEKMDTYANQKGDPAASKECARLLAIAEKVYARVQGTKEFRSQQVKMEMLQNLVSVRDRLNAAVKGYGGNLGADDDPAVLVKQGNDLLALCFKYVEEEARLVDKMDDQDAYRVPQRAEGRKLIRQMEEMQHRWENDYMRLELNYKKRNLVVPPYPRIKPEPAFIAKYEKKFGTG